MEKQKENIMKKISFKNTLKEIVAKKYEYETEANALSYQKNEVSWL